MSAKLGCNERTDDDEDFPFLGEFVNERGKEGFVSAKLGRGEPKSHTYHDL